MDGEPALSAHGGAVKAAGLRQRQNSRSYFEQWSVSDTGPEGVSYRDVANIRRVKAAWEKWFW